MSSLKKYVEITLGGKERLLKFDFNAVSDIEEEFGKGISAIFDEENVGFNVLRVFYWGGLKWKEPGLTIQRAGLILGEALENEEHTMETLMSHMIDALQKSKLLGKNETVSDDVIDAVDEEESKVKNG